METSAVWIQIKHISSWSSRRRYSTGHMHRARCWSEVQNVISWSRSWFVQPFYAVHGIKSHCCFLLCADQEVLFNLAALIHALVMFKELLLNCSLSLGLGQCHMMYCKILSISVALTKLLSVFPFTIQGCTFKQPTFNIWYIDCDGYFLFLSVLRAPDPNSWDMCTAECATSVEEAADHPLPQ